MCEVKSFEDLIERYSADEAAEHLKSCKECRESYGYYFSVLYPDIQVEKIRLKENKSILLFMRLFPAVAGLVIVFIVGIFFWQNHFTAKSVSNDSNTLSYYDCLDIMDNLSDDEFVEIINDIQEAL